MRRRKGWAVACGLFGAVIAVTVVADLALAATAADFSLELFDGNRLALKDFRGKAGVGNFWAST